MKTIHLPFWGEQKAIPVEQLEAGMVTMWTAGVKHEIEGVVPSKSGKTFRIKYVGGKLDHRQMRKGSLVAIA